MTTGTQPESGRWLHSWASAALLAASFSACGPAAESPTLVVALDGVPLTVDPHFHNDALTWSLLANFYEGLVRFTGEMGLEPSLAARWEQASQTRWRFTLRADAEFAGGGRVRAADVVASFYRARDNPGSRLRHHLLGITRVSAEDELTVVFETDGPQPTLLNRLAFLMVVPEARAVSGELQTIDGSGPYRVEAHVPGESLTAAAASGGRHRPEVRRVRWLFSWNREELLERFLAGGVDVLRQLPEDQLAELRAHPGLRAELQPRLQVQMLAVSPRAASGRTALALGDSRVRLAILLATDRDRYAREVFRGNAVVASQYVQPVVYGYDPSVRPLPHDPERARALLRAAGFPDGFAATIEYTSAQRELVVPVAADLRQIGVRVEEREMSWAELLRRARAQQSELAMFGWACSTGDAGDFLNACAHTAIPESGLGVENYSGYADATTDTLIDGAEREMDPARRLRLLQAAQARLLADLPVLPLTVRFGHVGVSTRVEMSVRHDQWLLPHTFRWTGGRP